MGEWVSGWWWWWCARARVRACVRACVGRLLIYSETLCHSACDCVQAVPVFLYNAQAPTTCTDAACTLTDRIADTNRTSTARTLIGRSGKPVVSIIFSWAPHVCICTCTCVRALCMHHSAFLYVCVHECTNAYALVCMHATPVSATDAVATPPPPMPSDQLWRAAHSDELVAATVAAGHRRRIHIHHTHNPHSHHNHHNHHTTTSHPTCLDGPPTCSLDSNCRCACSKYRVTATTAGGQPCWYCTGVHTINACVCMCVPARVCICCG